MKTLIISAHPNPESLNAAVLARVRRILDAKAGSEVRHLDLYKSGFDPVLRFDKENPRREMHRRTDTAAYRDDLVWADHVVFVYPLWWGRGPAVLMGWMDLVLAAGFAYAYPEGQALPKGLLGGRTAHVIATMKGPALVNRVLYRNSHRTLMGSQVLGFCGMKTRFLDIDRAETMDAARFAKVGVRLEKFLEAI